MIEMSNEELFYKPQNVYEKMDAAETAACFAYAEGYKKFLSAAKTERLAVKEAVKLAEARGFKPYQYGKTYAPGDKVYDVNRGKAITLAVIGKEPLSAGAYIAAAHVDSPRLDLKQIPLYEDSGMVYFKTHYYGGIKKYQWVAMPLELHGVVIRRNGTPVEISIGAEPGEPQLVITDLLPHLDSSMGKKTVAEYIPGENLSLLTGSIPDKEEHDTPVKLAILKILKEKYGIVEEDFLSAELEAVPAYDARHIGLDRSLIGGYGHDDRVCAYAELAAILDTEAPNKTSVCDVRYAAWKTYVPTHVAELGYPCREGDYMVFEIRADRFLRNMVRAIVGTLVEIGRGRREPAWMAEVLASGNRSSAGESVPGHALFLKEVEY